MITIKAAAEMTGLTIKSIRFYEDQGLFRPSARSTGGYRLYSEEDIQQLQQIRLYRDLKFSLKEIILLLDPTVENNSALIQSQLEKVRQKKREYERVSRILETTIAANQHQAHLIEGRKGSPAKPGIAIIGLDLQNDMLPGGALPCRRILTLLDPLSRLFAAARKQNIPIIYVCDSHQQGIDEELTIWEDHCIEGTWGAKIIDELSPWAEDHVIKKGYFNGFIQTDLQETLDRLGATTLIFVGWRTHVCVAQTAIEAFHRGYRVLIAKDGINSTTKEEHDFGLRMLEVNYGFEVYPCEDILKRATQTNTLSD